MALERVPSDIRRDGGVARMSDPKLIKEIKSAVSIPVMAKVRIGHIVEAEILEALGIDYIDESEVLTPPMIYIISTSMLLRSLLSAVPAIWAKHCAASVRERQWSARRERLVPAMW